jgi:enoyl-CoA hydratase
MSERTPAARIAESGGVHTLTLTRGSRRNALDVADATEIAGLVRALGETSPRVVVVTGEGSAFCAGAVLEDLFDAGLTVEAQRRRLLDYYACFLAVRALPCPTIAAVHGPAIGAGLNLALACDLRIAGPDARFGATFTQLGLHPGGGCSSFLVDAMGRQRALLTLLTGRTLDGREAAAEGLAAVCVDDPQAEAAAIAGQIAAVEPWLARSIVESVDVAARDGFDAALSVEAWAQAASAQGWTAPRRTR